MNTKRIYSKKGNILVIVMGLILMIVLVSGAIGTLIERSVNDTSRQIQKSQIEYFSEGALQISVKLLQDYLAKYPMKGGDFSTLDADLNAFIDSQMSVFDTSNQFKISSIDIKVNSLPRLGTVPMGAFAGMNALLTDVNIALNASNMDAKIQKKLNADVVLVSIKLFQFQMFINENLFFARQTNQVYQGRVHINKDICAGSRPFRVDRLTVGGRALNPFSPHCEYNPNFARETEVATDGTFTNFQQLLSQGDHGCSNCLGSGQDWVTFAIDRWNGHLLDRAHGVEELLLPIANEIPVRNACNFDAPHAKYNTLEALIIEPPQDTDTPEVKDQRLSVQADVRIINGVWYLKNPGDQYDFPGIPIWSDHPGRFTTTNEEDIEGTLAVGQDDIRDRWTGTGTEWPSGQPPKLFSYYEYNNTTQSLYANAQGTISYGNLYHDTVAKEWRPGHFVTQNSSSLCSISNCASCSLNAIYDATLVDSAATASCGGTSIPLATAVLNGTRSGIRDAFIEQDSITMLSVSDSMKVSKRLPLNFDVDQFQKLLKCDPLSADYHPGNLGCYFGTGKFISRPFNGIVYLSNTWVDSHTGLGSGVGAVPGNERAAFAPYQHQNGDDDVNQSAPSHPAVQRSLPFYLCSTSAAGQPIEPNSVFTVPNCNRYAPSYVPPTAAPADRALVARANTLRIINGSNLDPDILINGLTISTDLPIHTVGDYNTSSDVTSAAAVPWVSTWIVGDRVIPHSNNWDDKNARWDIQPSTLALTRTASAETTLNLAVTPPVDIIYSTENKTDTVFNVNGSQAKLFRSARWCYPYTFAPTAEVGGEGTINYVFDKHLNTIGNQPPGTPTFYLNAVKKLEK